MSALKIKLRIIITALFLVFGLTFLAAAPALADTSAQTIQGGINSANGINGSNGTDTTTPINHTITTAINILSVGIGVVAVIMLMVGGLRYITSGGVSEKTATAKKTILYALIGLAIVALAQVIANFVLERATTTVTTGMIQKTTGLTQAQARIYFK